METIQFYSCFNKHGKEDLEMGAAAIPMLAYSVYSSGQQRRAQHSAQDEARAAEERARVRQLEAEERARQTWEETAFPSEDVVAGMKEQGITELGRAKQGSYSQMASNLAARGIGPGSGLMTGGSEELEKGYLQAMGGLTSELSKWAKSPMFQMPSGGYGGYSPYIPTSYPPNTGSMLDTAFGMMMAQQMMGYGGGYKPNTMNVTWDSTSSPYYGVEF
jgi:hypothetical protein